MGKIIGGGLPGRRRRRPRRRARRVRPATARSHRPLGHVQRQRDDARGRLRLAGRPAGERDRPDQRSRQGGWAVVNTEGVMTTYEDDFSGIHDADSDLGRADVRNLSLMCDRIHDHEALAGIELLTLGSGSTGFDTASGPPRLGHGGDSLGWAAFYAMDRDEIRRAPGPIRRSGAPGPFGRLRHHERRRARGRLATVLFLMRRFNKRTDEYGGSFENRARFWLETLELVREAVGDDCAITARFASTRSTSTDEGASASTRRASASSSSADHLVDFWDLQVGGRTAAEWGNDAGPSRFFPENFQGAWVEKVRAAHDEADRRRRPLHQIPDTMVAAIRRASSTSSGRRAARSPTRSCRGRSRRAASTTSASASAATSASRASTRPPGSSARRTRPPVRSTGAAGIRSGSRRPQRRPRRARRRRRPRRARVRARARRAGPAPRAPRRGRGRDGRRTPLGAASARPRRVGVGRRLPAVQLAKLGNVELDHRAAPRRRRRREYGADIVVLATGIPLGGRRPQRPPHGPIPGADARLPHVLTPEQIMVEGKEPSRRAGARLRHRGLLHGRLARREARARRARGDVRHAARRRRTYMAFTGEADERAPAQARRPDRPVPRRHGDRARSGRRLPTSRGPARLGGRRRRPRDAARLRRTRSTGSSKASRRQAACTGSATASRRGCVADAIFDGHRLAREIDSPIPASRSRSSGRSASSARPTPTMTPSWEVPDGRAPAARTPLYDLLATRGAEFSWDGWTWTTRVATPSPSTTPCAGVRACGISRPCTSSTCAGPTRSRRRTASSRATSSRSRTARPASASSATRPGRCSPTATSFATPPIACR